ncbi:MAG: M28 family peptidase [Eubacterium sp.]|nr:M28 family peptidase [Eubacterium sp.]
MKFSDFPQAVVNENVDWAVREITNVIKRYGPRESGNENCLAAQKHIKKEMDTFCDETGFETYKMNPKAFLHFTKTVSVLTFLAIVVTMLLTFLDIFDNIGNSAFFLPQIIVGAVVICSLFVAGLQLTLYKPFCDIFYKKKDANNFYAKRAPRGEVKKRIVICGHIDAAYEWRHTRYSTKKVHLMLPLMALTICSMILSAIIALISIIANFVDMGAFGEFMTSYGFLFHSITAIAMVTLFFFVDFKTVSPGANDNLTGTYAAVCALRMLDMAGVELENTEVVALITDGEEAGLKGTKAWAAAHKEEYLNSDIETAVLCVDTLADDGFLNVYSKDMNSLVKNDKEFSDLVLEAGNEAGVEGIKKAGVFMGASDAAAFSQAGIKATTLAAMDPAPAYYYHNSRDNYDILNPEVIKAGFNTIISAILKFDE